MDRASPGGATSPSRWTPDGWRRSALAVAALAVAALVAVAPASPSAARAQSGSLESGAGADMAETMRTGLVPLFGAMGAGILVMGALVLIAVLMLRPRMPRLDPTP